MADYDFRSLSPHDFELLCRDLLQREMGVHLESFSTGPDSGIDLRYRTGSENLIVQCKLYVESGFDALRRVLKRKEREKLEVLKPTRYILATSVPMTPARKESLVEILSPHCRDTGDIVGRDDINNFLMVHREIEQAHFKLWLTSAAVLERVLCSGIFSDSDSHLERVRLRLSRYVPNDSFDRARACLDETHFCIVAGIPGIGKTTLAEVLLADLVDRQGVCRVSGRSRSGGTSAVKNRQSKQVFYFDDFLGKTSLDKLQKNEDQRLVELMEEVATNPNWRFILTTREYILNNAKRHYEAFAHPSIDFTLCVIRLEDYTKPIRVRILYNHIFFSDLPREYKLALLEDRNYETILSHRNYNPRVVEFMTQSRRAQSVGPTVYRQEFVDSLENPARIWDHAFRYQLSEASRHLLLVLATLPDETRLEDLERAFWKFYEYRQKRFGFATTAGDWENALRELDGNFIGNERIGSDVVVSFHSPSVRDFVEQYLAASESDVADLIDAVHFYEQFTALWSGVGGRRYTGVDRVGGRFLRELASRLYAPSARALRVASMGEITGVRVYSPSNESRVEFLIRVADELQDVTAQPLVESVVHPLEAFWELGIADRPGLSRLLRVLTDRGLREGDGPFAAARQCLLTYAEELEHFQAAVSFCETYPNEVSEGDRDALRSKFRKFAEEYGDELDDEDPDWLREVAGDLENVGHKLRVDTDPLTAGLYERAEEIESERAEKEAPDDYDDHWRPSRGEVDDVHEMFDDLRNYLMDN